MKSQSRANIVSVFLVTGISALLVFVLAHSHQIEDIDVELTSESECEVIHSTGEQDFYVYIPVSIEPQAFLTTLCDNILAESQYSRVKVSRVPRSEFKANHLTVEPFRLILSRDYFMRGILPGYESFYSELSALPKYSVYWLSHTPINPTMFESMHIGLLNDPYSQSGYMEPLRYLKHLQLDIRKLTIGYFHSRDTMLNAFIDKKVDLIPVAFLEHPELNDDSLHYSLINDQLDVGSWYMHRSVPASLAYKIRGLSYSYLEGVWE
ncbi:hypothetical protein J4N45_21005 [Vibrio sp. SCSIO 43140]|uniref:hypothetical protein n=1 Tax=Vibrio sp. SCSIO 43140 TaxID=2819100 RepID=UPI00207506A7|nr:hypothetical protein [Vibrio sp. SCSIO 43140]USD63462.1 hypothetical protein J4N45_21005 [Vibrio sp. SCSIO 43140]